MLRPLACAALIAIGLGACATPRDTTVTESAGYQRGYGDGCSTGYKRQDPFSRVTVRDEALFSSDANYQSGWRQGYRACGGVQKVNDPAAESQSRWYGGGPSR